MNYNLPILPSVTDSEHLVLGSIIHDNQALYLVNDLLEPRDFFFDTNANLYRYLEEEIINSHPVDCIVISHLSEEKKATFQDLIAISDWEMNASTSPAIIIRHANAIKRTSSLRKLVAASFDLWEKSHNQDGDPEALADIMQSTLAEITRGEKEELLSAIEVGNMAEDIYDKQKNGEQYQVRIPTGFNSIDSIIGGLKKQDLIILAGRPSTGKTAFACNLIETEKDYSTLIFSLEQKPTELWNRSISKTNQIDGYNLDMGDLSPEDWKRVYRTSGQMKASLKLWINKTPGIKLNRLVSVAKRLKMTNGLDLIIIDYLQLIKYSPPRNVRYERREVVAEISHTLKNLARELNVAILTLAHLNREVTAFEEPDLNNLGESGVIEQDADMVMFLWIDKVEGCRKVSIKKNRGGSTGEARLMFKPKFTAFYDA